MSIQNYLKFIQEGYIISDKTISVDLYKFESGEINRLYIMGLSGSGKSTIGDTVARLYKSNLETCDECLDEGENEINCHIKKIADIKGVLEGVGITQAASVDKKSFDLIMKSPCIFIGTSALKSNFRAFVRRYKRNHRIKLYSEEHLLNFTLFEKQLSKIRKARQNIPKSIISELRIDHNKYPEIIFQKEEYPDIKRMIKTNRYYKEMNTIRYGKELGKFKKGQIYRTPWQKIVEVSEVYNLDNIDQYKYVSDLKKHNKKRYDQLNQIKKLQHVVLKIV